MTLTEAILEFRQRNPLPEEEVLMAAVKEYEVCRERNYLEEALVRQMAIDVGDCEEREPDYRHELASLDCMLSLAREIVDLRVQIRDLSVKAGLEMVRDLREELQGVRGCSPAGLWIG